MNSTTVGERVKLIRTRADLSQEEFGNRLGMGRGAVYNVEKRVVEPKETFLKLICTTYGVAYEWLISGTGDMYPPKSDEEELAKLLEKLLSGDADPRIRKSAKVIIEMLTDLPEEAIEKFGDFAEKIAKALKGQD